MSHAADWQADEHTKAKTEHPWWMLLISIKMKWDRQLIWIDFEQQLKRARDRGKTFWDLYVLRLLTRVWLRTTKFGTEMHEAGKRPHRFGGIYSSHLNKKLSYLDKPARRDCRSVKSPNIAPFHMLDIVSYCAIVTLSFTIFDFKNVVTLKSGSEVTQGHWKWFHSIECVWFPISVL